MLKSSLHTNWVVRVFVLIYLALITSTGNAFFWCQGAEATSHLEANLSGNCWTPCPPESNRHQCDELPAESSATFSSAIGDCFDSPAIASIITPSNQNNPKSKATVADINTPDPSFILANGLSAEGLENPPLVHKLPPRQALTALLTIVLRQ